jgi:hypothetical protein
MFSPWPRAEDKNTKLRNQTGRRPPYP